MPRASQAKPANTIAKKPAKAGGASKQSKPPSKPPSKAAKPPSKSAAKAKPPSKPPAAARAAAPVKKRKPSPEPEPEPEAVDLEEGDRAPRAVNERLRAANRRLAGYRALAKEAGYRVGSHPASCAGADCLASLLSLPDAKRLMQFSPQFFSAGSFKQEEAALRLRLSEESVTVAVANVVRAHAEPLFRELVNQAVLKAFEVGSGRVDAANMHSILRPLAGALPLTSVDVPPGLLRHAQGQGILSAIETDAENAEEEKKAAAALEAAAEEAAERKAAKKAARKKSIA
jgi:hypothetical protein